MKKAFKSVIAVALCCIMLMGTVAIGGDGFAEIFEAFILKASAATSGTCGENLTWKLDDKGTLTISGMGEMSSYSYSFEPWYNSRYSIKCVVIENGVTSIGNHAFSSCTSLTSITIPDSVTSIGRSAFAGCSSLANITIPDSVTSIGDSAFVNCSSLTSITIPDSVISIDEFAFSGCSGLTSITIPNSVTSIGYHAFSNCTSLTSITIPNSVTSIGSGVFRGCTSLSSITVDKDNTIYDSRNNCNAIIETATNTLIAGCKNTIIPEGVTSIGSSAFIGCSSLTSITIPEGVTSIGSWAFDFCTSLTTITIPNSVTSIGDYAFYDCTSLTSITIPDSVTSIGYEAFTCCDKLVVFCNKDSYTHTYCSTKSVDYVLLDDDTDRYITGSLGTKLTWSIDKLQRTLTINCNGNMPSFSSNDAPWKEYGKYFLSAIIEDGCTSIGDSAFSGCTSLTEIEIPYSVSTIRSSTFSNCSALDKIYIYNRNCSIDSSAIPYTATIYGFTGSTAETFADKNGYYFVAIDDTHEHTFNDDDICKLCGYDNRHDHTWSEWTVTIENNCTDDGEKYRTCSICSKKETEVIEATGHSKAEAVKENEIKATCTEDGSYESVVYCNKCNIELSRKVITIPRLGHTAGNVVKQNVIPSTCVSHGKYDRVTYCSVCNLEIDRTVVNIAFSDHSYAAYTSNNDATCTKDGTKTAICTVCEAKNTITDKGSKLPHTDANKDGYCDVCKTVTNADLANPCRNAKINVASAKSVDYKAQVTIKATANGVPTGYSLAMYVNGKQVAKGSNTEVTYTVGQATSDINYIVKVVDSKGVVQKDANGNELAKDSKVTVNASFFAKIIAFFKSLFGSLPTVTIKP